MKRCWVCDRRLFFWQKRERFNGGLCHSRHITQQDRNDMALANRIAGERALPYLVAAMRDGKPLPKIFGD